MNKFYLATVAAVVITASLAFNVLVTGTRGAVRRDFPRWLRSAAHRRLRRLKYFVDRWVAVMIASRERQAAIFAPHQLSDRELRDIGLDRVGIRYFMRSRERRTIQANVRARR